MKLHLGRTIPPLLCIALLTAAQAACNAFQSAVSNPTSTHSQPAPTNIVAPVATATPNMATPDSEHKAYIAPLLNAANPIPDDWPAFESPELGIQFRFPPLPGEASYEYHNWPVSEGDPSGILVEWQVTRNDRHETYTFAAVESEDMRVGRERWFTDIIRWFYDEKVQKYYVVYGGSKQPQVEVQPLGVITRNDGLQGIIFTPDYLKGPGTSAVLNLPDGYSLKLKVISFYFPDPLSLDDVALVLNSVTIKQ